jgi:hypothetical protein
MKKSLLFVCLIVACLALNSLAYAGWHDLTQAQRNQAIVDEANSWNNGDDGGQCKVWVQSVVYDASDDTVWLPTNNGYCSWNSHTYVVGRSQDIVYVLPGEIVQMQLSSAYGSGPHTFIVVSKGLYGITVKESNWCADDCEEVGTRYITFINFNNQADCYTLHYIE